MSTIDHLSFLTCSLPFRFPFPLPVAAPSGATEARGPVEAGAGATLASREGAARSTAIASQTPGRRGERGRASAVSVHPPREVIRSCIQMYLLFVSLAACPCWWPRTPMDVLEKMRKKEEKKHEYMLRTLYHFPGWLDLSVGPVGFADHLLVSKASESGRVCISGESPPSWCWRCGVPWIPC